MSHSFRERLKARELLVGTMVTLGSPEVAEIMADAGFDWLFLDAEHSALGTLDLQRLLQGAGSTPGVVRVEASAEVPIKKALDIGAAGIIAPLVNSAEQAEQVVGWAKYAPLGTRGVGIGRAQGYGAKFQEYVQQANETRRGYRAGRTHRRREQHRSDCASSRRGCGVCRPLRSLGEPRPLG